MCRAGGQNVASPVHEMPIVRIRKSKSGREVARILALDLLDINYRTMKVIDSPRLLENLLTLEELFRAMKGWGRVYIPEAALRLPQWVKSCNVMFGEGVF